MECQSKTYARELKWPRWLSGRETTCKCRDEGYMGSIPGSGRFPGGGNDNSFQYSCLKHPTDRGAWWAMVHGVAESWTQLSNWMCMHAEVRGPEKPSPKILILYLIGLLWGPCEQSYVEVFCKLLRKYTSITHSFIYAKWNEKCVLFSNYKRNKRLKILYVERVDHTTKNVKQMMWEIFLLCWYICMCICIPIRITVYSSVQSSHSVVSDSFRPHESQHARPPCPSPTPGVYSNSCPSSRWCHPAISSSVVPFSSCPQSLPATGSFPMSQ